MTRDSQKRVILFLGIFSLLYLSSCGWFRKEQREQVPKEQEKVRASGEGAGTERTGTKTDEL